MLFVIVFAPVLVHVKKHHFLNMHFVAGGLAVQKGYGMPDIMCLDGISWLSDATRQALMETMLNWESSAYAYVTHLATPSSPWFITIVCLNNELIHVFLKPKFNQGVKKWKSKILNWWLTKWMWKCYLHEKNFFVLCYRLFWCISYTKGFKHI